MGTRKRRFIHLAGKFAAGLIAAIGTAAWCVGDEPPAGEEPREPFTSPLTNDEARWLMDEADGRRFRDAPDGPLRRSIEREAEAVRDSLGGSVIREFPTLDGDAPQGTPWWQRFRGSLEPPAMADPPLDDPRAGTPGAARRRGWGITLAPNEIVPAAAEEAQATDVPVATLRDAAAELDASANRLEQLELYEQADQMRRLAQKLRIDARRMAAGEATAAPEADSRDSDDSAD